GSDRGVRVVTEIRMKIEKWKREGEWSGRGGGIGELRLGLAGERPINGREPHGENLKGREEAP
ncbi:MAG TPA: hypothetical protein VK465_14940, partial [Fibrobacteria bacterium]|nr:hypothetical protein [Fibrobacteria bacterium]